MDCIIIHVLTLTLCSTFPHSRVTIAYPGGSWVYLLSGRILLGLGRRWCGRWK